MTGRGRDQVWRRDEPDSPCQSICLIDPASRTCIGCNRTPEEIAGWARLSPGERAAIRAELPNRAKPAARRRGGRAGRVRDGGKTRED